MVISTFNSRYTLFPTGSKPFLVIKKGFFVLVFLILSVYIVYIHVLRNIHLLIRKVNMKIVLSSSSDESIYLQIVRQIRESILQGELVPGEALPSIRQLAKDLQISVITTKRAYNELEQAGLIDSIVGKGSFVSGGNKQFIIEQRTRMLEDKLREVLAECRSLSISTEQLIQMIEVLQVEEGGEN